MHKKRLMSFLFSRNLQEKSVAKKIAYIAVVTAFTIVSNVFEFKFVNVQFSLTILISALAGLILGAGSGFIACFLGDFLGFLTNSGGYAYMPWVGLTTAVIALISGLVFNNLPLNFKGSVIVKTLIVVFATFLCGTILINTTGFYIYNKYFMGLSKTFLSYVNEKFGGNASYIAYAVYRLFALGQIYNSIANYALLFIIAPILLKIPLFKPSKEEKNKEIG